MKSLYCTAMLLFCLASLKGQSPVLDQTIKIQPGLYAPAQLMENLKKQGLVISYPNALLREDSLQLENPAYNLKELLEKLFNPKYGEIIPREGKILIAYKKGVSVTYSGYIEEQYSGERIIGVHIYFPDLRQGTTSNEFGFYSITVSDLQPQQVVISAMGYENQWLKFSLAKTQREIILEPRTVELATVEVSDEKPVHQQIQSGRIALNQKQLKEVPAFFGEPDVLKTLHFLPGVQMANEGNINFLVRGGSADQNLILLDGVPVYNASHLFGFFSAFNSDAVKNVELTKGGFSSRYGGRLSSVLEVNTIEGNMQEYHGSGGIGIFSADLMIEGPIVKDQTSFMISGRRSYQDWLLDAISESPIGYYFGDFNAKVNHKFSRKDRLYLSFYTGKDDLSFDSPVDAFSFYWGNYTGVLRWNHLYNDELFSNLSLHYSRYKLGVELSFDEFGFSNESAYFSSIEDIGGRYDLEYTLNSRHHLNFGASYTYHTFKPGILNQRLAINNLDSIINIAPSINSHDGFIYVEDQWRATDRLELRGGLHLAAYNEGTKTFTSLQPRFSALYHLSPKWSLKASMASMQQFVQLMANQGTSLPTDIWVSSSERIPPQRSWQISTGAAGSLWDNFLAVEIDAYYKQYTGLISYKPSASIAIASNWEDQVLTGGQGESFGLEFLVRKTTGALTGWIGYGLAKSQRQFDQVDGGDWFPFKFDRRHDFKVSVQYKATERFNLAVNWVYSTGQRGTIPVGNFIDADGEPAIRYSDRNAFVYPAYHRLDVAFNFPKETSWGQRTWSIGAYNAYSRNNPFFIYFSAGSDRQARQLSLLPILPYISYQFSF